MVRRSAPASRRCVAKHESCDFFLAQDRRKVKCSFWVGSLGDAPGLLESLGIEKPESRQMLRNGARRQFALLKQLGLVFANVSRPPSGPAHG
jgi:hypothetical protein